MTPQEILELSEPLEAVYTDTVTQLIANICKRLGEGKELPNWQAKKLAELDALTDESIQIISRMTGRRDTEIRNAISKALNIELKDVEAVLTGAAAAGAIAGIGFTVEESQGLKSMAQALIDQAETRANLVNTVMLNSTRQRYIWAVNSTADREQKLIEQLYSARNYDELEAQLSKVQAALNKAAGAVEVGAEARVQALSRTVKELAQEGITGYIDRGGHHWSPEAYMNMDIRTTVHNTAVQAQKTRAEEYGVETFQISSHGGARPLCAPYQGKFYSWDGSSGVVHDLRGNEYFYESIYDTSYGEPAGIFGINCGHNPQTFVDGYNIPRYEETKDAEANAAEYRESQKQRYYEREVRQAKLEAIAQDAAGNKDAFNQAAAKVRQANANYKEFCKSTGRTPRPDRLQVYASPDGQGYNRSMSGKVTGATRGWKPTEQQERKNLGYSVKGLVDPFDTRPRQSMFDTYEQYEKAKVEYKERMDEFKRKLDEAVEKATSVQRFNSKSEVRSWAKSQGIVVDDAALDNLDIRAFNESSYALEDLFKRFPEVKQYEIEDFDGSKVKTTLFKIGVTDDSNALLSANGGINFSERDFGQFYEMGVKRSLAQQTDGFNVVGDGTFSTLIRHEYGHNVQSYIEFQMSGKYHNMVDDWHKNFSTFDEYLAARQAYQDERDKFMSELRSLANLQGSSEYSNTNINELFAEGFAEYTSGGETEFGKAFGEFLKRWY